jgi:hypothetical protein
MEVRKVSEDKKIIAATSIGMDCGKMTKMCWDAAQERTSQTVDGDIGRE